MRREPGFVLVDVLFALFILGTITLSILTFYTISVAAIDFSGAKTQAAYAANSKIEEIHSGLTSDFGHETKLLCGKTYNIYWTKEVIDANSKAVLYEIKVKVEYLSAKGVKSFESNAYHIEGVSISPQW